MGDHRPIFTETYMIAEKNETEVLEEIEAEAGFLEAFIQTGEEAIVSFEFGSNADDQVRLTYTTLNSSHSIEITEGSDF